jgi:hypothetical protein
MTVRKSWRDVLPVHPAAELFPLVEGEEFDALVEDVRQHRLRLPIIVWDDVADGNKQYLLEGRNRLRALLALGLELDPDHHFAVVGHCEATRDPYALVLSLNLHRRHLTAEQKREIIAKVLKAKPETSNNTIAKQVKVDDKTVAKVRRDMEGRSEIPNVEVRTDTMGRKQPAKRRRQEASADWSADDRAYARSITYGIKNPITRTWIKASVEQRREHVIAYQKDIKRIIEQQRIKQIADRAEATSRAKARTAP